MLSRSFTLVCLSLAVSFLTPVTAQQPTQNLNNVLNAQQQNPDGAYNFTYSGPETAKVDLNTQPGQYWFKGNNTLAAPVQTPYGTLQGLLTNNGTVITYFGVPYAQPPIGHLRFNNPEPITKFNTSTYSAAYPKPACAQPKGFLVQDGIVQANYTGLDCLYINIWVPSSNATMPAGGFPIWAFSPGGSNLYTGYQAGDQIVQKSQSIIQIYIQYRVNVEGWLAIQGSGMEHSPVAYSGNWGAKDQLAAFDFIKKIAPSLGGNPNAITIGGQSAGSQDTSLHLVSPLAAGKFNRAIPESGNDDTLTYTLPQAYAFNQKVAAAVNCNVTTFGGNYSMQLDCLRNTSWIKLWYGGLAVDGAAPQGLWGPVIDGDYLVDYPANNFTSGKVNNVSVLTGSTGNEWAFFVQIGLTPYNSTVTQPAGFANYVLGATNSTAVVQYFSTNGPAAKLYTVPTNDTLSTTLQLYSVFTNAAAFWCPNRRLARTMSAANNSAYLYSYFYVPSDSYYRDILPNGAAHASELECVFQTPFDVELPWVDKDTVPFSNGGLPFTNGTFSPTQQHFCNQVSAYWTNFIINGNPNNSTGNVGFEGTTIPTWSVYNKTTDYVQQLGNFSSLDDGTINSNLFQWESVCSIFDLGAAPSATLPPIFCATGYNLTASNHCVQQTSS